MSLTLNKQVGVDLFLILKNNILSLSDGQGE